MPEEIPGGEIEIPSLAPTQRLVSLPPMHLRDAQSGAGPSPSTALRLGWRGDRLLVRLDCRHRGIVATLRDDNFDLWTEDVVEAFLALEEPPSRYLELEVNPLGAKFSATVESPNLSRNGMSVRKISLPGFQTSVNLRERRWSAVMSISLSEVRELLSTPAALRDREGKRTAAERREGSAGGGSSGFETFRANFFRIDRTSGEFSALFPTFSDPPDFHVPERFGRFRLA